jgi:hypothetical protein
MMHIFDHLRRRLREPAVPIHPARSGGSTITGFGPFLAHPRQESFHGNWYPLKAPDFREGHRRPIRARLLEFIGCYLWKGEYLVNSDFERFLRLVNSILEFV